MLLLSKYMRKYIRFPTGTRFGWLGFLVFVIVIASLEDVAFQYSNGVLGRILGLLGIVAFLACMIESIDHLLGGESGSITDGFMNLKQLIISDKKRSLFQIVQQSLMVGFGILAFAILVFIVGASI
jgi:hypothetical protein